MEGHYDADSFLLSIERNLSGIYFCLKTKEYITPPKTERFCQINEKGVRAVIDFLSIRVNNLTSGSKITTQEYDYIMRDLTENLWSLLLLNKNEFEVELVNVQGIVNKIQDICQLYLSRSREGWWASEILKNIFSHQEKSETNTIYKDKEESKSFLGWGNTQKR